MSFSCRILIVHPDWLAQLTMWPSKCAHSHSCLLITQLCQLDSGSQWDNTVSVWSWCLASTLMYRLRLVWHGPLSAQLPITSETGLLGSGAITATSPSLINVTVRILISQASIRPLLIKFTSWHHSSGHDPLLRKPVTFFNKEGKRMQKIKRGVYGLTTNHLWIL